MKNIEIYWTEDVIGIFCHRQDGQELFRVEEPIKDRTTLTDSEVLVMIDKGLGDPYVSHKSITF